MCLRTVHWKGKREMVLFISSFSPTIKCDLMDICFATHQVIPVSGTVEQPSYSQRSFVGSKQGIVRFTCVSSVRAYASLNDAAKPEGRDEAKRL